MSIDVGGYKFEGPHTTTGPLKARAGVYAILCSSGSDDFLVDVGESGNVWERLETHDRQSCWERNCRDGALTVAVLYTPYLHAAGRRKIESAIRELLDPPCGER